MSEQQKAHGFGKSAQWEPSLEDQAAYFSPVPTSMPTTSHRPETAGMAVPGSSPSSGLFGFLAGKSAPRYTLNDTVRSSGSQQSDPYYYNILVGGANAGGGGIDGLSYLPFGVLAKGDNRVLFRHNQEAEIRKAIDDALAKGLHPRVVGHSWGGGTVANLAKDYPDVPFWSLDPVGWFNRPKSLPKNLTVFRPSEKSDQDERLGAVLAPIFGGRWPVIDKDRTVEYHGGHVEGIDDLVNGRVKSEWHGSGTANGSGAGKGASGRTAYGGRMAKSSAYISGFMSKCAEYGVDGGALLKMAGPSLRDRAAAGVPGAKERLRESEARQAAHKSLSNMADKQRLNERGRQYLASLPPEERQKFYQDMWGHAIRTRMGLASAAAGFGGMGLVGGSAMEGVGEALASKAEGRSTAASLGRGALAGGASYGLGKGVEAVGRHVVAPAYRWAAPRAHKLYNAAAPRVRRLYNDLVKTVPRVSREWSGGDVHKAALQAARQAEPNPISKLWRRVTFRDPMQPSADAAADVYANDIYRALHERALGRPSLEDAARRIASDIDIYNGELSPQGMMLLRTVRSNPDLFLKDNKAITRLVSSDTLLRGRRLNDRQVDAVLRTMSSPFSAYRSDVSELMGQGLDYDTALRKVIRDRVRKGANKYTAETFIGGVERRARGVPLPKKGYTHDELMSGLGRDGDFIFKGGNRYTLSSTSPELDGPLWYSHNPYVSEGYATSGGIGTSAHPGPPSTFWAVPIGKNGAISAEAASSRFTPHIATPDEGAILQAAKVARGAELAGGTGTGTRLAGRGSWGDDGHYEIVLRGLENQKAHDLGRRFLMLPGKTPINSDTVVRGPVGGFGDTARFFQIPNGTEGDAILEQLTAPSYERVRNYFTKAQAYITPEQLVDAFSLLR